MKRRHLTLATAVLLLGALTACGGDDAPGSGGPNSADEQSSSTSESGSDSGGTIPDGRAFDSNDEVVKIALKSALSAEKVEFDGNRVLVHMATGSVSDPMAGLHCLSITTLIGDDELGFFVYPDGEYDCRDRP